jgi:glycosyltransferase involved in cell wall biosynthesis
MNAMESPRIAILYLGRRGWGPMFAYQLGLHLNPKVPVRVMVSNQVENITAWQTSHLDWYAIPTFTNSAQAAWGWLSASVLQPAIDKLRSWSPDVLIFPIFHPWNEPLQRGFPQTPAVVFAHDPQPHPGLTGRLHAWFENGSIRRAQACAVMSQSLVPLLQKRGVPASRIHVIPLGIYASPALPGDQSAASPSTQTILFFGRITPYKGLDVLLSAFRLVQAQYPQARLLVAGEGDLRPYRSRLAELTNVEIDNRWIPEAQLGDYFSRACVVALPYTSASQSGVLPLAAHFGLPVIATRSGGLPEQVQDGVGGYLVEPGSVESLRAAIEKLLQDPQRAKAMGVALQRSYQEQHNWQVVAEQTLAVCQALVYKDG